MLSPVTGDNSCRLTHLQHPTVHVATAIRLGICFCQNSSCPPFLLSFWSNQWQALESGCPDTASSFFFNSSDPARTASLAGPKARSALGMEALPTKYHGMLPVEATNQKNKLENSQKKKRYCIYLEFDGWEANPHVSGPATETTISDQQRPSSDPGWCTRASEWGKGTRTAVAVCPESVAKKSKGWWKDVELQR